MFKYLFRDFSRPAIEVALTLHRPLIIYLSDCQSVEAVVVEDHYLAQARTRQSMRRPQQLSEMFCENTFDWAGRLTLTVNELLSEILKSLRCDYLVTSATFCFIQKILEWNSKYQPSHSY